MNVLISIALVVGLNAARGDALVVHEWGTFTSLIDPAGQSVRWHPVGGDDPLPSFVYGVGKFGFATVRMETPVVYFYAPAPMTLSLTVDFPHGQITEWYPQAANSGSAIAWREIELKPGATALLPVETKTSRYYGARDTDAVPLSIPTEGGAESEKFLFYRGLGDFALPLDARPQGNELRVTNVSATDTVPALIRFARRDGVTAYTLHGPLAVRESITLARPEPEHGLESLRDELVMLLVRAGLYEREARAMLKTWDDTWFAPGERLIYLVPRALTDAAIPMTIQPRPDELVRVLVGRMELCDDERLKSVQTWPTAIR